MPIEAFGLALAAAFYPPAILAMIAVVRGDHVRRRVFTYLFGAATMTFVAGAAMLVLLDGSGLTQRSHPTPAAGLELALGLASLGLAACLWKTRATRRPTTGGGGGGGGTRTERFTRRLELIFVLGFLMYAPSPLY